MPIQDVLESWEKPCFGIGGWINEDLDNRHVYVFDPTQLNCKQIVVKFFNCVFVIGLLLGMTLLMDDFSALMVLNGAVFTNVLVLILPNAMFIHQAKYGYLKGEVSKSDVFFAHIIFYFGAFIMCYATFRATQQLLGV